MKDSPNKINIIIPKKGAVDGASVKRKQDILKTLKNISSEDIEAVGEEINSIGERNNTDLESQEEKDPISEIRKDWQNTEKEELEIKNTELSEETCSEEHLLAIQEYMLKMGIHPALEKPMAFIGGETNHTLIYMK